MGRVREGMLISWRAISLEQAMPAAALAPPRRKLRRVRRVVHCSRR